jgi:predicted DNA-binding transcriptional regulator YafY
MKAVRLLAILARLQARGLVTAQELAQTHEVSVRTIYRDIDALSAAGFPVYGDAGPGGGFRLLDVPTQRLTGLATAEAEAMLLVGLPWPAAALGFGQAVGSARDKLLLRLGGAAQTQAEKLAARFHIDHADWYHSADTMPALPQLARAVLDERQISFRYDSWQRQRDWTVNPLGIVLKGSSWYLVGQGDRGIVMFRVGAMTNMQVRSEGFERPANFDLALWWQQALIAFEARLRPYQADLILTPSGAARLAEVGAYAANAVSQGRAVKEGLAVSLPFESPDQAARLLLSLGPECQLVAPTELIDAMRAMVNAISVRLPV